MTVRVLAQKDGATAETHRLGLSLFMAGAGAAVLDRRPGIVQYPGAANLTGVSPMVGRISPFVAWVDGTSNSLQGGYPVVVDANEDITFDNGEAGNSRIDRVVLQIRDNPYDASTFQDGRVVIVKGQSGGAANPVPASSILLWETTVPAGASVGGGGFDIPAASVDKRTYTAALGGVIPVADQAERDALTAHAGLRVFRLDAGGEQVYDGSAWVWDSPPLFKRKTAETQVRNNTTSAVNDDTLFAAVKANAVYTFESYVIYDTTDAADFFIEWTIPSGASLHWVPMGIPPSVTITEGVVRMPDSGLVARSYGAGGGDDMVARPSGLLTVGGTAGTLQMRWAQLAAVAFDTRVRIGSWIKLERVG